MELFAVAHINNTRETPRTALYPSEIIALIQYPVRSTHLLLTLDTIFFNLFYMLMWYIVTVPTLELVYLYNILH